MVALRHVLLLGFFPAALATSASAKPTASIATATTDDFVAPWYCHGIDCPTFANSTVSGVEVRQYPSYLWASTNVSSTDLDAAADIGFDRLFDYISGANADGVAIDMTSPVLNRIVPGAGPNCNSTFIISFFVPYSYQADGKPPPQPTSDDVYVSAIGPLTVAVSEFGGFASQKELVARAAKLESDVDKADGLAAADEDSDDWFFAGYDPPFRLTGRHNEIWLPVMYIL